MVTLTYKQLDILNDQRRAQGLLSLTKSEMEAHLADEMRRKKREVTKEPEKDQSLDFALGLAGVPMPSALGIVGFALHESVVTQASVPDIPDSAPSWSGGGGDFSGGGSDGSF